jgi:hypothetical protein
MAELDDKERARRYLSELVPAIRERRKPKETEWLRNDKCWGARFDRTYFGDSVAQNYIPAGRRAIEKFVARGRSMLVPSPQFFECYPLSEQDPVQGQEAEAAQLYVGHVTTNRIRIRSFVDQLLRSLLIFERAIAKVFVEIDDIPLLQGRTMTTVRQVWPTARVIDPFLFYMWPETITSIRDASLVVEDAMLPYDEYERLAELKICDPIERNTLSRPDWPYASTMRLSHSGISEPTATPGTGEEPREGGDKPKTSPSAFVRMSYAWFRRGGIWREMWLVWNVPDSPKAVRYQPAPLPEPPYLVSLARPIPGIQYTSGVMSDIEPLNVLLNDQVNMTFEAQFTEMSPPVLVNPLAVHDKDSMRFRPRAKWLVDPEGVKIPNWPQTSRSGYQGVGMAAGWIDQYSGTSGPLPDGQPSRGMPRAGFAVTSLIQLSMSDIKAAAELLEDDILTPMLNRLYWLGVMFTPEQQRMELPAVMGLPSRVITPAELVGNWTFKWIGSLQSQDYQVRAQRLVAFLGVLGKVLPFITQAGKTVNWDYLLKRIWRDGLGERGGEQFLMEMTPQQMVTQMMMQGGMGGPAGPAGKGPAAGQTKAPASAEQGQRSDARQMSAPGVGTMA